MHPKTGQGAPPTSTRREEETYSIHLTLLEPGATASTSIPLQTGQRDTIEDLFAPLPDTAKQGQHQASCRTQRKFLNWARNTKALGSPVDVRFGPLRIDWADRVPEDMTSLQDQSTKGASSSSVPASTSSQPLTKDVATALPLTPNKKRVFHTRQPQVSVPVADFEKTDSFEGDAKPSASGLNNDSDKRLVSVGEKFEGMAIGATEVAFGIVHLSRDKQEALATPKEARTNLENQIEDLDVGSIVAVLAVPSYLTASDFLSFIEPAVEAVTQLRMVRDMHPNRCIVLIKFRDAQDAEDFHKMFNGQPFNAMDPEEICQVVYVTSITVSQQSTLPLTYPTLANSDPWPLKPITTSNASGYELPTCPVCLERMDASVTGLMTISCQHTFHCSCLSKWGESRCPVCRYSQTGQRASSGRRRRTPRTSLEPSSIPDVPELADDADSDDDSEESQASCCAICQTQQDLWVCLICASVGCGRYKQGHAHRHFDETGHLYSLELETQRVWDYAGDGYVHRLIQNKADGKLVELPSASSAAATPERSRRLPTSSSYASVMSTPGNKGSGFDRSGGLNNAGSSAGGSMYEGHGLEQAGSSMAANEKIEAIELEYSYLLTSQLESQRHFYEEKLDVVTSQLNSLTSQLDVLATKASSLDQLTLQSEELKRENETLKREKEKADKKAEKALELARKFESERSSERSISQGLMDRLEKSRESETRLRAEVQELREQVQDLMFFVQAREKVDQEGGEAQGGDLEVKSKVKKGKGKKK